MVPDKNSTFQHFPIILLYMLKTVIIRNERNENNAISIHMAAADLAQVSCKKNIRVEQDHINQNCHSQLLLVLLASVIAVTYVEQ